MITNNKNTTKSFSKAKQYLIFNFNKKNNLYRLMFFFIAILVVVVCSWPMHAWAMQSPIRTYNQGGFIQISIILNEGISFGTFSNQTAIIYTLQTFMNLLILTAIVCVNKWYYVLPASLSFGGGLFNLIDRMCPKDLACSTGVTKNAVLDYFQFFGKSAIFNFPDVFVIVGVIGVCIAIFVVCIKDTINDKKNKEGKNEQENK